MNKRLKTIPASGWSTLMVMNTGFTSSLPWKNLCYYNFKYVDTTAFMNALLFDTMGGNKKIVL